MHSETTSRTIVSRSQEEGDPLVRVCVFVHPTHPPLDGQSPHVDPLASVGSGSVGRPPKTVTTPDPDGRDRIIITGHRR